jgi:hypothetical protein
MKWFALDAQNPGGEFCASITISEEFAVRLRHPTAIALHSMLSMLEK